MDIVETLDAIREIDKLTRDNPAILIILKEMKGRKDNVITMASDCFVTQKLAAKILGTSAGTLCRLVKKNKIHVWVLEGQTERRYRLSDLYRFMDECEMIQSDYHGESYVKA